MTNEELTTALYKKMYAEQEKYCDRLLSRLSNRNLRSNFRKSKVKESR